MQSNQSRLAFVFHCPCPLSLFPRRDACHPARILVCAALSFVADFSRCVFQQIYRRTAPLWVEMPAVEHPPSLVSAVVSDRLCASKPNFPRFSRIPPMFPPENHAATRRVATLSCETSTSSPRTARPSMAGGFSYRRTRIRLPVPLSSASMRTRSHAGSGGSLGGARVRPVGGSTE